jgi:hypothetical protein
MRTQDKLKVIAVMLFTLGLLFITVSLSAQRAYVYSISKDGLTTDKEVVLEIISVNEVWFWTSKKNVEKFKKIGKGFDGNDIWIDSSGKNIVMSSRDGIQIFAVSPKKAFYYSTNKK